jgi:hypothetical protein
METIGPWLVIAVGAFIVWKAWTWKKNRGNPGVPPRGGVFVRVPGEPVRKKSSPLFMVILVAVLAAILLGGPWLLKHVPQLPPTR